MAAGIGNHSDHVGRYFMDHLGFKASVMVPTEHFPLLLDREYAARHGVNANLSFTDDFVRSSSTLQYYCRFRPPENEELWELARRVYTGITEPGSLAFLSDVAELTSSFPTHWPALLRRTGLDWPRPSLYLLEHRLEQAPNPDSRVILSDRLDALGNRIADLDWRINDDDVRSFVAGQSTIAAELAALNYGRVQKEELTRELIEERLYSHYHQIGTTRMSDAAADGVVDVNCCVHGVNNLYVGGSSVFPTAGYSGPTMMLIALAYRLSDHLQAQQ